MNKKYLGGTIFLILTILSCTNQYVSRIAGKYVINDYESDKPGLIIDSPTLELFVDESFLFVFQDKKRITGTWRAGDDGDRIWIDFHFNGILTSGNIGGGNYNLIYLNNPKDFGEHLFKKLSLKKIGTGQ